MTCTVFVKVGDTFVEAADTFKNLRTAKEEVRRLFGDLPWPGQVVRIEDDKEHRLPNVEIYHEGTIYKTDIRRNKIWKRWARLIPSLFTQELITAAHFQYFAAEMAAHAECRRIVNIEDHRHGFTWTRPHRSA